MTAQIHRSAFSSRLIEGAGGPPFSTIPIRLRELLRRLNSTSTALIVAALQKRIEDDGERPTIDARLGIDTEQASA